MQNFNDSITNDRVHNTERYRTYQKNLNLLNRISGYDELYMDDIIECNVCHQDIIEGENMVRQGFHCDNIRCREPRIYHLACLHRWIWSANRIPYCHICRLYPRT